LDRSPVDQVLEKVRLAVTRGDWDVAVALVEGLRPPDQADLFSDLPPVTQDELLPRLDSEDSADILEELEEEAAAEVATRLELRALARIVDEMEPDEAADLLGDIPSEQATEILSVMEEADKVRPLLDYPDDSAGGLMTSAKVVLRGPHTVAQALHHLREVAPDSEDVYYLFVTEEDDRLVGVVSLRQLIVAAPTALVRDVMDPDVIHMHADADREEAARVMARYDLLALPVVDTAGRLMGLITHDDLVDVLEKEATEDIYRLGGIAGEQPTDFAIRGALWTRLPWLVLNLGTALSSAAVLSMFEDTIARVAVLTAFFPVVAGVSGSAGTQTLTVTVRLLALGEISRKDALAGVAREVVIGLTNGVAIGALIGLIALLWKGTPVLGLVVGVATLLNLISAGISGALIPLAMERLHLDPALVSPVLVTTITDGFGYFVYLGLATLVLSTLV
jgi:magnesium transporter